MKLLNKNKANKNLEESSIQDCLTEEDELFMEILSEFYSERKEDFLSDSLSGEDEVLPIIEVWYAAESSFPSGVRRISNDALLGRLVEFFAGSRGLAQEIANAIVDIFLKDNGSPVVMVTFVLCDSLQAYYDEKYPNAKITEQGSDVVEIFLDEDKPIFLAEVDIDGVSVVEWREIGFYGIDLYKSRINELLNFYKNVKS